MPVTALPDLALPATGGKNVQLTDLRGKKLVLYFYPKDNTSGCTNEATDFAAHADEFAAAGALILGISRDSVKSHEGFKARHMLPFDLLADVDEKACAAFDLIESRNRYGKQVRGLVRSTFLFDADGRLVREWRAVKVPGHVLAVLAAVRET
ncbi:MAG: peroxiredoxin [Azoarcus sp.]|jgi:peroxiredoxin Q/BCP|nr:peroxiredoxin [Azoarcus sp.]